MKKTLLLACLTIASISLSASGTIDMGGTQATLDTIDSYQIGPGVIYSQMRVTKGAKVRTFNLMDVDLNNPYNNIELVVADGGIKHMETLSKMSKRLDAAGHRMMGGMNCTPYIMGVHEQEFPDEFGGLAYTPCYGVCSNGWPVASHTNYDRGYECNHNYESGYFAIDINKKAYVNDFYFNGYIAKPTGEKICDINELNRPRTENTEDRFTLFNKYIGTTQQHTCTEILFSCDQEWITNGDMTCTVTGKNTTGGTALTGNNGSIQGINGASDVLATMNIGDIFTLHINMEARDSSTTTQITQMGGGFSLNMFSDTLTVRNTQEGYSSMDYRRPMIGTTKKGDRMWLMEIESPGMSTAEGCYILKHFGANDAAAFDGGGSAQMYILGGYVQPSTDAGGERSLPVGLWVVGTAEDSEDAGQLAFVNPLASVPSYASYTPQVRAWTKDGMFISHDYKKHRLSVEPASLGTISEDGLTFTASPTGGSGKLIATYGSTTTETPIEIKAGEVKFLFDSIVLGNTDYTMEVQAVAGDLQLPLSPKALTWQSDDETVATVSNEGVVHGVKNGKATITGTLSEFQDQLGVNVELVTAQYTHINGTVLDSVWTDGIDTTFSFKSTRNAKIELPVVYQTYGAPDSVIILFQSSTAIGSVSVGVRPTTATKATSSKMTAKTTEDGYKISIALDKLRETEGQAIYPVYLSDIKCFFSDVKANTNYTLSITDIILCFHDWKQAEGLMDVLRATSTEEQKIMVNGQVYILKQGVAYTIEGKIVK